MLGAQVLKDVVKSSESTREEENEVYGIGLLLLTASLVRHRQALSGAHKTACMENPLAVH